ncbi:hypothetical protein B5F76_10385 [Desulfovibrio sp. An276]|uniref:hypothetical protein n=1 Tax=Desulfovibrio sp. An276 TaxID=1965618 RepID=UPI000B36679F|nr:hypothetical protein [Desulfovibrio sp. An276]OUO51118.1 hypothetical protein B5F76_10385 [Desulfovibrio sp. An276]
MPPNSSTAALVAAEGVPGCNCCVRRGRPLADAIAAPGRTRPAAEEGSLEFQKVASQHVFLPWVPGFSADK